MDEAKCAESRLGVARSALVLLVLFTVAPEKATITLVINAAKTKMCKRNLATFKPKVAAISSPAISALMLRALMQIQLKQIINTSSG